MISLFRGFPRKSRPSGFTLIELVLVLMLAGILGTIVAGKYFDMQEQAAERVCSSNRNTVLRSLFHHFANAKLSGAASFESTLDATLDTVFSDLTHGACTNGSRCAKLCPAQDEQAGTFKARYSTGDAGTSYQVVCSIHGQTNGGSRTIVDAQFAGDVMAELIKDYDKSITDATRAGAIKSIEDFFSIQSDNIIDSEAVGDFTNASYDYGSYSSITEAVLKELSNEFDMDNVIFQITRSGSCTTGQGSCNFKASYQFTVANVDKNTLQAGDSVQTRVYSATVYYGANTGGQANAKVVKWDPMTVTTGTAVIGTAQSANGGPVYKVLKPAASGTGTN